jgi:sodium-dependent dicarboxylate transporter 2/3/5
MFKKLLLVVPFAVWFLPIPESPRAGLFILLTTAVLWIGEFIPLSITALLVPVLSSCLGVLNVKDSFSSFAHPIIFLFFGGFVLATALSKHKIDKFVAFKIVSSAKGSVILSCVGVFLATALVSMWISNTSTTAMMLPLALGIAGAVGTEENIRKFLLLGTAYSASIGGIATVVGSPPNGITSAYLDMSFSEWLKFSFPVFLVLFPVLVLVLYLMFPLHKERVSLKLEDFEFSWNKERITVLIVFILTVSFWLFSKKLSSILDVGKYFDSVIAVGCVILLVVLKTIDWNDIQKGVDWGTLLLFGGGITLSKVLKTTGASKLIASVLANAIKTLPLFFALLVVVMFMIFVTELMSNTATAAIFVPILGSSAVQMNLPPVIFALPAGISASCAFMLPVATPPNAIVYGTGLLTQKDMMKAGFVLNIVFSVILAGIFSLLAHTLFLK